MLLLLSPLLVLLNVKHSRSGRIAMGQKIEHSLASMDLAVDAKILKLHPVDNAP